MKATSYRLILLAVFCFFRVIFSLAQPYSNLKVDLVRLLGSKFNVTYEHSIGKLFSGQLTLEGGNYAKINFLGYYQVTGVGATPEFRCYPWRKKNQLVQPFVSASYRYLKFVEEFTSSPGNSLFIFKYWHH
jgi:hypothetical protein